MKRDVDILEISDGRFYRENDMVKADCGGCVGCSMCCRDMVDTIVLDPLDVWHLTNRLGLSFEEMLVMQTGILKMKALRKSLEKRVI